MKVCFVSSSFARREGDYATPWLVTLIKLLRPRGVEVKVFAPAWKGLGDQELAGITVKRFRYAPAGLETLTHEDAAPERLDSLLFKVLTASYIVCGFFSACLYFLRERFDVIHVHWPFPQALFVLPAKALGRPKVVFHFHGTEVFLMSRRPLLRAAFRLLMPLADAIVANSPLTAAAVKEQLRPGIEPEIIPFGPSLNFKDPRGGAPAKNPPVLLFAGKFIERKGAAYLIEALCLLRDKGVTARARLAGDGPQRKALETMARGRGLGGLVEFTGFLASGSEELRNQYLSSDLFVFPSVTEDSGNGEGLGAVAIDAMLAGLPLVMFDAAGAASFMKDGETAFIAPEKDARALAAKIELALADYPAALRTAGRAREMALKEFSWDAVTARFEALYRRPS